MSEDNNLKSVLDYFGDLGAAEQAVNTSLTL